MIKYTVEQMEDFQWLVKRETDFEEIYLGAAKDMRELPSIILGIEGNQAQYNGDIDHIAENLKELAKGTDGYFRGIDVIKAIRGITGCGLKEAKDAFDKMKEKHYG